MHHFQVRLPFSSLRPIFRARTVLDAPPFDPSQIMSLQVCYISNLPFFIFAHSIPAFCIFIFHVQKLQLMFSKFESDGKLNPTFKEGPFELPVSCIRAYLKDTITPRLVSRFHFYIVSLNLQKWSSLP